jgi:hypothetical protein
MNKKVSSESVVKDIRDRVINYAKKKAYRVKIH